MKLLANYLGLAFCILWSSSSAVLPVYASELIGTVVGVSDGDTITVLVESSTCKVRLANIDCPEKKQAFGQQAKLFTSNLCFKKRVEIEYSKKDKYSRIIGFVRLPDGRILNEELLKNGYAWCYTKYCKNQTYPALEQEILRGSQ
jgi:micrococcal nuclease